MDSMLGLGIDNIRNNQHWNQDVNRPQPLASPARIQEKDTPKIPRTGRLKGQEEGVAGLDSNQTPRILSDPT